MTIVDTKFKESEIGPIPEEWNVLRVADVARVNEKVLSKKDCVESIKYLDTAAVESGTIGSFQNLELDLAPSRAKRILRDGDTIVSTVRPNLKHFAFIKGSQSNWIGSTGFAVVTPLKVDPRFLYFSLTTDSATEYLSSIAASQTSTYPAINPDVIENLLITVPPEIEQRQIAEILSSFDDKIELNRKINANLEKLASALFKKWFVNIGDDLPEGWRMGKVSDLIRVESGFPFNSSVFDDSGNYKLVTIKNVQDGYFVPEGTDSLNSIPEKMPEHCKLKNGNILLSLTGNVGRVCIVYGENYLLNQRVAILVPLNPQNKAFAYLLFRQKDFQNILIGISRGTAQQNLSPIETRSLEIVIPSAEDLTRFAEAANPIFEMIVDNLNQIKSLSATKDSLLPRLMSGRIRVNV